MNVFYWLFTVCNRRHVLDAEASLSASIIQLRHSMRPPTKRSILRLYRSAGDRQTYLIR